LSLRKTDQTKRTVSVYRVNFIFGIAQILSLITPAYITTPSSMVSKTSTGMQKNLFSKTLFSALLTIGLIAPASAKARNIAVGLRGGSAGVGGEVTIGLLSKLNFRSGLNFFSYDGSGKESETEYDYTVKLRSVPLLLDYHPFDNGFKVTSGIFINNSKVTGVAQPEGMMLNIGGIEYEILDIGDVNGKIDFRKTSPYVGIGWGNALNKSSTVKITVDIGVLFQGKPNVTLEPTIDTSLIPGFDDSLEKESADLKKDLEYLQYYPVVSAGVAYSF